MKFTQTLEFLQTTILKDWAAVLPQKIEQGFDFNRWGDLPRWQKAVEQLPEAKNVSVDLNQSAITLTGTTDQKQ